MFLPSCPFKSTQSSQTIEEFCSTAEKEFGIKLELKAQSKRKKYVYSKRQITRKSNQIIKGMAKLGDVIACCGAPKSGKTLLLIITALACATGQSIGRIIVNQPMKVLFIDWELEQGEFEDELEYIIETCGFDRKLIDQNFDYFNVKSEIDHYVDIETPDGKEWLKSITKDHVLVIADNFREALNGSVPNATNVRPLLTCSKDIARAGKVFIWAHHFNDDGKPLGSKAISAFINLRIDVARIDENNRPTSQVGFYDIRDYRNVNSNPFSFSIPGCGQDIVFQDITKDTSEKMLDSENTASNKPTPAELNALVKEAIQSIQKPFKRGYILEVLQHLESRYRDREQFKKAVSHQLKNLVEDGTLNKEGEGSVAEYTVTK